MSEKEAKTPRVFLVRHGETEWARLGRATGTTDIGLTEDGIKQVEATSRQLVGPRKLMDPNLLAHIFVSPRKRARQTFQGLLGANGPIGTDNVTITEDIAEWDYGDYEGLTNDEIRALRKQRGLDNERPWYVWRDGCEGGETMQNVTERLDRLISRIRDIQRPCMMGQKPADVLLVSHGLILTCFAKRWLRYSVDFPLTMMLSPGAIAILSYKNNNIEEPAFFLGMSIPPTE